MVQSATWIWKSSDLESAAFRRGALRTREQSKKRQSRASLPSTSVRTVSGTRVRVSESQSTFRIMLQALPSRTRWMDTMRGRKWKEVRNRERDEFRGHPTQLGVPTRGGWHGSFVECPR